MILFPLCPICCSYQRVHGGCFRRSFFMSRSLHTLPVMQCFCIYRSANQIKWRKLVGGFASSWGLACSSKEVNIELIELFLPRSPERLFNYFHWSVLSCFYISPWKSLCALIPSKFLWVQEKIESTQSAGASQAFRLQQFSFRENFLLSRRDELHQSNSLWALWSLVPSGVPIARFMSRSLC